MITLVIDLLPMFLQASLVNVNVQIHEQHLNIIVSLVCLQLPAWAEKQVSVIPGIVQHNSHK